MKDFFVVPSGKRFGKQEYLLVGMNIRSPDKTKLERLATLKNKEVQIGRKMLKPDADIIKLSNEIEKVRDKIRWHRY